MAKNAELGVRVLLAAFLVPVALVATSTLPTSAAVPPGRSITNFRPAAGSTGQGLQMMGDGATVVVGNAGDDFALYRSTGSPTLDVAFGTDGKVTTDFGGRQDIGYTVAEAPGGSVVAAGSSSGDVAVVRYTASGALDRAFGTEGRVTTDLGGDDDAAFGVLVQESGNVVVAGGSGSSTVVLRYRPDGGVDQSFGSSGRVHLPWGRPARAIVAQPDGAMVVVGSGGSSVDVARLTADGALDSTFGAGGIVRLATGAGTSANGLTLLADGRMVVAGGRGGDVLMVRLLQSGAVDPTFGISGVVASDLGRNEKANGVVMSSDGRIRVVGEATDGTGFCLTLLSDGTRDTAPAFGGLLITVPLRSVAVVSQNLAVAGTRSGEMYLGTFGYAGDASGGIDFTDTIQKARASTRQPDGRIVVVGETSGSVALLRYTTDGILDPTFGLGGRVVSDLAWFPRAVAVQPNGRILVAGVHGDAAALVGFKPDGSIDLGFGTAGRTLTDVGSTDMPTMIMVLPDAKLLVGGGHEGAMFLARYSPSGIPDATFGTGGLMRNAFPGYPSVSANMLTVTQPDGKIVATAPEPVLARFDVDGHLDPSFGTAGVVHMDDAEGYYWNRWPTALILQPDGRILVGGTAWFNGQFTFAIARLNPDGSRDTSWPFVRTVLYPGSYSYRSDNVGQLFLEPDGSVLAVGDEVAARYRSDGSLDETFGNKGLVYLSSTVSGMVGAYLGSDGELLTVGSGSFDNVQSGFVLAINRVPTLGRFHPLRPARILDTRAGIGRLGKIEPASTKRVQVTGQGGVPDTGVSAVVLNLTATEPTSETFLTVWPGGSGSRPLASNLNPAAGQTLANQVVVALGPGGEIDIYNDRGTIHVIADVAGWYGGSGDTAGTHFHALTPARTLDTRNGTGAAIARLGPGASLSLQVAGRGGVPVSGASAVVLNLTVTEPTAVSYVTAWPAGQVRPLASNLNVVPNQTVPNLVTVAVGAGGKIGLFNAAGSVHLVADVAGWFDDGSVAGGARLRTFSPKRILDTRFANGGAPVPIGPAGTLDVQVTGRGGVPAIGVTAVIMNVTVTQPTASTHLTVFPSGQARPLASNLNFVPGQTIANLVVVPVGEGGRVSFFNAAGQSHVVADVSGWYGA